MLPNILQKGLFNLLFSYQKRICICLFLINKIKDMVRYSTPILGYFKGEASSRQNGACAVQAPPSLSRSQPAETGNMVEYSLA